MSADTFQVVIVTHESRDDLERCLPAVEAAARSGGGCVLVADNASTDGTVDFARSRDAELVKVLALGKNRGYAGALNAAAGRLAAPVVIVLNPDIRPVDDAVFVRIAAHLRAHPEAGAVAPRLLDPDGGTQASARVVPSLAMLVARQTRLGDTGWGRRKAAEYLAEPVAGDGYAEVEWALGAALAFRRDDLERLGGWDERFFLYFEDVDFCLRLRQSGRAVHYLSGVEMVHDHRRASARRHGSALSSTARREHVKSALRFFAKHPGCLLRH